ncbi:MAG: hypothetical protein ABT940_05635 [Alphaproteobacteria bacterium]
MRRLPRKKRLPAVLLALTLLPAAASGQDVRVNIEGGRVQVDMPNIPGLSGNMGEVPGGTSVISSSEGTSISVMQGGNSVFSSQNGASAGGNPVAGNVRTQVGGNGGNSASFNTGIAPGASIQGVSVINGEVSIDGEKVPPGTKRFTSRSGKKYVIDRGNGGVVVRDE